MLFWDKHQVALLKTRISENPNYLTQIFQVTRMPRLSRQPIPHRRRDTAEPRVGMGKQKEWNAHAF
jgi:hypothetical protein